MNPRRLLLLLAMLIIAPAAHAACRPATCVNLVLDGDSISAGAKARPGHGLDAQLVTSLGNDIVLHNVAVGGRPVFQCLALFDQTVTPLLQPAARRNVIVFHAGDNDISAGRDAAQTYAAFSEYVARADRQGWMIIVSTELRRPDFSPGQERQLELYNRMLLDNAANADAVVDLDTDPRFADLTRRSDASVFSSDHIHPNEAGYGILAAMLAPAVRSALAKP